MVRKSTNYFYLIPFSIKVQLRAIYHLFIHIFASIFLYHNTEGYDGRMDGETQLFLYYRLFRILSNFSLSNYIELLQLIMKRFNKSVAQHFFPINITTTWNALTYDVVNSRVVNTFKNRLDAHWEDNLQMCSQLHGNTDWFSQSTMQWWSLHGWEQMVKPFGTFQQTNLAKWCLSWASPCCAG